MNTSMSGNGIKRHARSHHNPAQKAARKARYAMNRAARADLNRSYKTMTADQINSRLKAIASGLIA